MQEFLEVRLTLPSNQITAKWKPKTRGILETEESITLEYMEKEIC